MRLWSLHPSLLDRRALVALWREGLLAQKVLAGGTRGYTRHPQLQRFRACARPLEALGAFLAGVRREALRRGYRFDGSKILRPGRPSRRPRLPLRRGQLEFEWSHLRRKVARRDPAWGRRLAALDGPRPHPLFRLKPGPREEWEKG